MPKAQISADVLADRFAGGRSAELIALEFGLSPEYVMYHVTLVRDRLRADVRAAREANRAQKRECGQWNVNRWIG